MNQVSAHSLERRKNARNYSTHIRFSSSCTHFIFIYTSKRIAYTNMNCRKIAKLFKGGDLTEFPPILLKGKEMKRKTILKTLRIYDGFFCCKISSMFSTATLYWFLFFIVIGKNYSSVLILFVFVAPYFIFSVGFLIFFVFASGGRGQQVANVKIEHLKKYRDGIAYRKNQIWISNPIVMPFFPFIQLFKFVRALNK